MLNLKNMGIYYNILDAPAGLHRQGQKRSLSALGFRPLIASDADNDFGIVEWQVIDAQVEAVSVGVCPQGTDRLPELLRAVLSHWVHAMCRAVRVGFSRHD